MPPTTPKPYAKVVADSVNEAGDRLTTVEVVSHRWVLPEWNTHRVKSRSNGSNRAIPVPRTLAAILNDTPYPLAWAAEQKGMQGGEDLPPELQEHARLVWDEARNAAVKAAMELHQLGLHKSLVNRLLEPFTWQTSVLTGTAWKNFFRQRCSPLAQPEIRVPAEMIRDAMATSIPRLLIEGEWHLPYVLDEERESLPLQDLVEISAARTARTSYLTHDGRRDTDADLALYEKLVVADPHHAGPLEHVATPNPENKHQVTVEPPGVPPLTLTLPRYGNLLGWHQHRFDVEAGMNWQAFS